MVAKIIKISDEKKEELYNFLSLLHPNSTAYIHFCIDEALNVEKPQSLLVINDKEQIVGCHMFFETKAWIKGEERKVVWGYDTFLDEGYRKEIGLDFVIAIASTKDMFGYGLSDVNKKIQKRMPTITFIGDGLRKFCLFNPWILWGTLKKIFGVCKIPQGFPNELKLKDINFNICTSVDQISIPNDGYWNKDFLDVDFVRDKYFLNKRFFFNPVHKYNVYTCDLHDAYFVVRPILFKGIPTIFLVDYRYEMRTPQLFDAVFDAAELLCRKMHIGVMLYTASDKKVYARYNKSMWCKTKLLDIVANNEMGVNSFDRILVTAADSDGEYRK